MRTLKRTVPLAVVFAAIVFLAEKAAAAEAATIVNHSGKTVEMYLRWSHHPCESPKLILAPGGFIHQWGPDGAVLHLRFNSTPGFVMPPREVRVRVITVRVWNPSHPGFASYFRDVSPHEVAIFNW